MAKIHLILLAILLLAPLASASCSTYCELYGNITVTELTGIPDTGGNMSFVTLAAELGNNIDGFAYMSTDLSNVYINAINLTSLFSYYVYDKTYDADAEYMIYLNVSDGTTGSRPQGYIELCLNATAVITHPIMHDGDPTGALPTQTPSKGDDFTQNYARNWTFRDESDGSVYDFSSENATLKVWCDNLDEFEINLTDVVGTGGSLTIYTLEKPKYFLNLNLNPSRIRQDKGIQLVDGFYITTAAADLYTLRLVDYTGGQFYKSTLSIQGTVNDALNNIHVEEFPTDNIIYAYLQNNTQYKILLDGVDDRDLGQMYVTDEDLARDIVVTKPSFSNFTYRWDGLIISFTEDWANSNVGCNFNSTTTTACSMEVYNITGSDYILDYASGESSGTNVALTFTVDNNTDQYIVRCIANDTTYGLRDKEVKIEMWNETGFFKSFELNIPDKIVGVSRAFFYKMLALTLILTAGGIFSTHTMGTGAVVMSGVLAFTVYINWFPVSQWFVGFIAFMSFMIKLSEGRQGVPS